MRKTALLALLLLAACKHSGGGEGELEGPAPSSGGAGTPEGKVEFTWQSGADPSSGDIQATLPDGKLFTGTFLQVRSTTTLDSVGPYYQAWAAPGWGVGDPWYGGGQDAFVTEYSGRALAHLMASDGTRMRCNFVLRNPQSGMAGGGSGDCQLSNQESIFDAELRDAKR